MFIVLIHVLATNDIELSVESLDGVFIDRSSGDLISFHNSLNGFDDLHLQYFNNSLTVLNLMIDAFAI